MKNKIKKKINYFFNIHHYISTIAFYIGALLQFLMALFISYEVGSRYLFNKPTSWAIDFSQYILIYSSFLAGAYIFKIDGHTKIDILVKRLSVKSQTIINIFIYVIELCVLGILIYLGCCSVWENIILDVLIIRPIVIAKWKIIIAIPLGFLFIFGYVLRNIVEYFIQ